VKLTAYIGKDGAIYVRARSELLNGQEGRPLGDSIERVGPGEELAGRSFDDWHRFLKERGGAASLKV
jgi:hypothetical protein